MIKKIILALVLVCCSISAQARDTYDITGNYNLPSDMLDCKIYQMRDGLLSPILYVTKCPLSKTSTTVSKKNPTTTILDYDEDVPESPIIQMNGKRYMEIK